MYGGCRVLRTVCVTIPLPFSLVPSKCLSLPVSGSYGSGWHKSMAYSSTVVVEQQKS